MRKRVLATILTSALIALLVTVCLGSSAQTAAAAEPPPVKIAAAFPLSGNNAEAGQMGLDGAVFMVNRINDAGGIKSLGGAKIELVIADTTSDALQARTVVERILDDEEIVAFLGPAISSLMLTLLPVIERNEIPAVTNCAAVDIFNQGYKFVFGVSHPAPTIGANVARAMSWLAEEGYIESKRVALVYENSAMGIQMSDGTRRNAGIYGLEIVFDESFPPGITDASAIVTSMKNSGADIFIPSTFASESKLFIDTMRSLDYHPFIIGPVAWPSLKENLGDSINGIFSTANWNAYTKVVQENPEHLAIVEEFEATHNYPFMSEQSALQVDCVRVLQQALEGAGSRDRQTLRDYLSANSFETMQTLPTMRFDPETGENITSVAILHQWQDGIPYAVFPTEYAVRELLHPDDIL